MSENSIRKFNKIKFYHFNVKGDANAKLHAAVCSNAVVCSKKTICGRIEIEEEE